MEDRVRTLCKREQADRRWIPAHARCLWQNNRAHFVDDTNAEILVTELELGFRVVERMEVEN